MKHKHAEFIHLMANGVRIERLDTHKGIWETAYLSDFDLTGGEFRIVKQKKWRWMYTNKHNTFTTEGIYLTPLLTEEDVAKWVKEFPVTLGPRQDWTEVCDE
jgi:hypothetical protein